MKTVRLFWIDDMLDWAISVQDNLMIIAKKYEVNLEIKTVANGEDAALLLMMHEYDGVIMDYHMKPFNGDKYIEDIRREEHLWYIPILFYSQDTAADLASLVKDIQNVRVIFRPNLEDSIIETFIKPLIKKQDE